MAIESRARAAVAVAFVASLAAFPWLPPDIPPELRVEGETRYVGAPFLAFLLPTAAAVIWWLFGRLSQPRPARPMHGRPPLTPRRSQDIGAATALFLSAFHVTILIAVVGHQFWLGPLLGVIVGLYLIATGNDLPRVRPNLVWGIRTPQTLARDDVWRRVHRMTGHLRVVLGAAVCCTALVSGRGVAELIFAAILIETIVGVGAGLVLSRQTTA